MKQRAHVGSAAWVEAPVYVAEFSQGGYGDHSQVEIEEAIRSGARYQRVNPAQVAD